MKLVWLLVFSPVLSLLLSVVICVVMMRLAGRRHRLPRDVATCCLACGRGGRGERRCVECVNAAIKAGNLNPAWRP